MKALIGYTKKIIIGRKRSAKFSVQLRVLFSEFSWYDKQQNVRSNAIIQLIPGRRATTITLPQS